MPGNALKAYQCILKKIYTAIKKIQNVSELNNIFNLIVYADNIFSCFIENDNQKIIVLLKKMKNIYGKFLKRKKLYYFLNYYNKVKKICVNELLYEFNENESSIPFALSEEDTKDIFSLNNNIENINSYYKFNPVYNSSAYSFFGDTYNRVNREQIKNKFSHQKNLEVLNRGKENNNYIDMFLKNIAIANLNNNIKQNQTLKKSKSRRALSYGDFEVKTNRNNEMSKVLPNKGNYNNYIINNSNIINNNTQSLKGILPSYSVTSPNGLFYPIIFSNSNENYINNNNINSNILYNYQDNSNSMNNLINANATQTPNMKPSFWYAYSPGKQICQVPYNYSNCFGNRTSKNITLDNNYSEDYLNKQIFDFINASAKTKENIISNISKKHKSKLNKSNGAIKLTNSKSKLRRNNSFFTINTDEASEFCSDIGKLNKNKDKSFEYNKVPISFSVRPTIDINNNNMSKINTPSDKFNNNHIRKKKFIENVDNIKNQKMKKNITEYNFNKNNGDLNNNFSKVYNKKLLEKQQIIYSNNKSKSKNKIVKNERHLNINNDENIQQNNYSKKYQGHQTNYNVNKAISSKNENKNKINLQKVSKVVFNSNKNKNIVKKYEMRNIMNKEYIQKDELKNNEDKENKKDDDSLRMSLQSMNDSKMFELANFYVEDGGVLDKGKINEILDEKSTQKIIKKYK